MDNKVLTRYLLETYCYRCRTPFKGASSRVVASSDSAALVHLVCPKCGTELLAAFTLGGSLATSIRTDLKSNEVAKFFESPSISSDDLLNLHAFLKSFGGDFKDLFRPQESPRIKNAF